MNIGKYYYADVKLNANISILCKIDAVLKERPACHSLFFKTCFGHWFWLNDVSQEPSLLHFMLSNLVDMNIDKKELIFEVAGKKLHFGPEQFCLISGMKFGVLPRIPGHGGGLFRKRVFAKWLKKTSCVCVCDVDNVFDRLYDYNDLDVVRISLLLLLHKGFIDSYEYYVVDDELLRLVENLDSWNDYPWGSYIWGITYQSICESQQRVTFFPKIPKKDPNYQLQGFMFIFKIWILEVLPYSRELAEKDRYMRLPRAIAWTQDKDFGWLVAVKFDKMSRQEKYTPRNIQPTSMEKKRPYYQETMRFLHQSKEDIDSLLAKFERRFNLEEVRQEETHFSNMEHLLEVLWNKAYPNSNVNNFEIPDEELLQFLATQDVKQPVTGSHELLNKPNEHFTDEDILNCLKSMDDDDEMISENVDEKYNEVSSEHFEPTAQEFYNHGEKRFRSLPKRNHVDHYCIIKDFPYHLDMDFWGRLLDQEDNGWLLNEHIDVWSNMVALSPLKDQRCGILPVVFHKILEDCERIYDLANGTEGPCPPWWTLDRVLFPLNRDNKHWMLAELDLRSWVVTVYDSNFDRAGETYEMREFFKGIGDKLYNLMPVFLDKLDYWEKARVERVDNLQLAMQVGTEVPQQSDSNSCGIYVCHFIEKLAHGHPVHIQCGAGVFQKSYRQFLTDTIYSTRIG